MKLKKFKEYFFLKKENGEPDYALTYVCILIILGLAPIIIISCILAAIIIFGLICIGICLAPLVLTVKFTATILDNIIPK